jgi:hypothetical protein
VNIFQKMLGWLRGDRPEEAEQQTEYPENTHVAYSTVAQAGIPEIIPGKVMTMAEIEERWDIEGVETFLDTPIPYRPFDRQHHSLNQELAARDFDKATVLDKTYSGEITDKQPATGGFFDKSPKEGARNRSLRRKKRSRRARGEMVRREGIEPST